MSTEQTQEQLTAAFAAVRASREFAEDYAASQADEDEGRVYPAADVLAEMGGAS